MPDNTDDYSLRPSLRWNSESETKQLALVKTNEYFEREGEPIELDSPASTFIMDMRTRATGKGRIAAGTYCMLLSPYGEAAPPIPEEQLPHAAEFRRAIGVDLWNPRCGFVRLEATAAYVCAAIYKVWNEFAREPEAAAGQCPVIRFVGARPTLNKKFNKLYYPPIVDRVGAVPREKVPEFAANEPTVPLPVAVQNDSQVTAALRAKLEAPRREELSGPKPQKVTRKPTKKPDDLESLLDDDIGDL
jgi:hypothetical protein